MSPRSSHSYMNFSPEAAAYSGDHSGERPQVLAQLAKDISDLIHSARSGSSERAGHRQSSSPRLKATTPPVPSSDRSDSRQRFSSFNLGGMMRELQEEPASRGRGRSTQEVNSLFSNIENREAALHQKDEPSSCAKKRSSQEVHALLSNIESREAALHQKVQQLTEEKAMQQQRLEEEVARLQRSNARMEEELRLRKRTDPAEQEGGLCARTPLATRAESPPLPEDVRDELQQQLSEIRAEVTRCAQALHGPEALPASEVVDIRHQLAALSNEVVQTSRALLEPAGVTKEAELPEVCQQLEALQGQVSRAMHATFARPAADTPVGTAASSKNAELSELRAEVDSLRAMVVQALRRDVPQTAGTDLPPQSLAPEVSVLNGRLAALRAEVARIVQGHRVEDMASPRLQAQLGALLQELQEVRSGAAAIAAATAGGGGPLGHQLHAVPMPDSTSSFPTDAWQARQHGSPRPVPTPSRCSARTCDPARFVDVDLGVPDWTARAARSNDLGAQPPPLQPMLGVHSPPLLLCPHLAADLAAVSGACGGIDGVDFTGTPALQQVAPGVVGSGHGIPLLQRPVPGSALAPGRSLSSTASMAPWHLHPSRPWDQPGDALGAAALGGAALGGAAPNGHGAVGGFIGSNAGCHWMPQAPWCGAGPVGDVGAPADEPLADHAPQGAMSRPLRTKIPRAEAQVVR